MITFNVASYRLMMTLNVARYRPTMTFNVAGLSCVFLFLSITGQQASLTVTMATWLSVQANLHLF